MTAPFYKNEHVTLYHGDCIDVMRTLPAQSVDAVVTSPPYAMQRRATYGGVPESEYPSWTVAWMSEVRRVLKPEGSAVINIRPHVRNGQISDYALRTRLALRESGWCEIEELIWHKPDGAPVGHVGRPRRSWESLLWFAQHGKPYCDPKANGRTTNRVGGVLGRTGSHVHGVQASPSAGIARSSDVLVLSVRKNENDRPENRHPAPYPPALAEWVGRLVCPPGGTILDPFSGSASTGVACIRNGWGYIGIDAVEEYVEISARRLHAEREDAA